MAGGGKQELEVEERVRKKIEALVVPPGDGLRNYDPKQQ